MDNFEKFITDLINNTIKGRYSWEIIDKSEVLPYLLDRSGINQVYLASGLPVQNTYVYAIELAYSSQDSWGDESQMFDAEIIVVRDGLKIMSINKNYVDEDLLSKLLNLLKTSNTNVTRFFDALYEQPDS
jgi:hypothetical protein